MNTVGTPNLMDEEIPRYSQRPFPAYRFVPGRTPHPTRDPEGHSYGVQEAVVPAFEPDAWASCAGFLYGVDLFNRGYWWEAHEAWEALWKAAGRRTEAGLFLQGLIQVSVSQLKLLQGFDEAAQRLARDGLDKLSLVRGTYLGIDVASFRAAVHAKLAHKQQTPLLIRLEMAQAGGCPREGR